MSTIVAPQFPPATNRAPTFAGKRRPDSKYAREWVRNRLRTMYREFLAGQAEELGMPAAYLYVLLSNYILDDKFITELIEARELVAIMHCKTPITATRARERLIDRGEVELVNGGQGNKYVQFAFLKMAGPLYAESGGAALDSDQPTSQPDSQVTLEEAHVLVNQIEKLPEPLNQIEKLAEGSKYNDLRTTTRCRWHGSVHAWCDGRVHVPMQLHAELRRRQAKTPGETDSDVDERLYARYAHECAQLADDEEITVNDFVFWKQRFGLAAARGRRQRSPRIAAERLETANVWTQALRRIESKVGSHAFYTWLRQTTLVEDRGDTIDVEVLRTVIADWIARHYRDVVHAALGDVNRPNTRVQFVVNGQPYCSLDGFAAGDVDVANVVSA